MKVEAVAWWCVVAVLVGMAAARVDGRPGAWRVLHWLLIVISALALVTAALIATR